MKSTSPGRVAEVPHALRFTKDFRPRHFVQMVFERHRMCNELKSLIQTAVRFDVQVFGILIRNVEQLLSVAVYRAAVVDFELNAEMTQTFAMKNKVWCVAVLMDNLAVLVPAGRAVSVVVIVPVRAVAVDNPAAVIAADVILIEAVLAKRMCVVLDDILLIKPFSTVVADYGQAIRAVLAEPIAFHFKHLVNWMLFAAICTNSRFTHCLFLHFVWLISIFFGKQHSRMR